MRRKAFTLVELLVVIVVIAVLAALLLPALAAAVRATKRAAVAADIQSLNQSLVTYTTAKLLPPSAFLCREDGDYSMGNLAPTSYLNIVRQRSIQFLQGAFGKARISQTGPVANIPGIGFYDFNGNGKLDPPYLLTGDECLVFFLGGMPKPISNSDGTIDFAMIGLGTDPANPWQPDAYTIKVNGVNTPVYPPHSTPFFEFRSARLLDLDGDGMPNYIDAQGGSPSPYAYFARYGGNYNPDDCNFAIEPSGDPSPMAAFRTVNGIQVSPAPNPYAQTPVLPAVPYQTGPLVASPLNITWIGSSFQIISSGSDRQFGPGGWYAAKSDTRLPFPKVANDQATSVVLPINARDVEKDNITSFSQGMLQ